MAMSDRIKSKRKEVGLTQEELAQKLGLQKSAIAKYENGRVKNIKRSTIAKMSEIFDCSPTYLMDLDSATDKYIENVFTNDNLENIIDNIGALSSREKTHFKKYLQLIEMNRRKADNYIEQLLSIQQMDDDLSVMAAHERTDIKVTNEMRKHDDDIMMDDSEWEWYDDNLWGTFRRGEK